MTTGNPNLKHNRRGTVAPPDASSPDRSLEVGQASPEVEVGQAPA